MDIANSLVRRTHERAYVVFDAHHYILKQWNLRSKTMLEVDKMRGSSKFL